MKYYKRGEKLESIIKTSPLKTYYSNFTPHTSNLENMSYIVEHLAEAAQVLKKLDIDSIEQMTYFLWRPENQVATYLYSE